MVGSTVRFFTGFNQHHTDLLALNGFQKSDVELVVRKPDPSLSIAGNHIVQGIAKRAGSVRSRDGTRWERDGFAHGVNSGIRGIKGCFFPTQ